MTDSEQRSCDRSTEGAPVYYSEVLERTYQLLDRDRGEVLVKAGCVVLIWYKYKQKSAYWYGRDRHMRNLRAREIRNISHGNKLWPSTERAFREGTMMFAVEVE